MTDIKPSDYKTRKEYKWAKKAQAKEQTAPIRALIWLVAILLIPIWIISGSFVVGIAGAVGVLVVLMAVTVLLARMKAP